MRSINVISNPHGCGLLTMSLSNKTLQENNMNIHLGGYQQICHISIWLTKLDLGLRNNSYITILLHRNNCVA